MTNGSWRHTTLGTLVAARGKSVDPSKYPNDLFELYSVPSFPERKPEIIGGKEIGSHKQEVHPRSVLLCKINPRINRAWVVGDFSDHPKVASTEWIIFPENEVIEPAFLSYFLQQNSVRDFLAANASGVGGSLMRVKPSTLRDFPFAYPPLDEQQRIVAEIEKQFTRLDAGVASLKRVQTALKRYRASVLKAACEGRLVPTEARLACKENRSYETGEQLLQRILKERREKWNGKGRYKEPVMPKPSGLPQLPEGWTRVTVDQLSVKVVDGTHHTPTYVPDGVPFISVKDVRHGKVHFDDCKYISAETHAELIKRCHPQRDDILITKSGTIGRIATINADTPFSLFVSVALIKPVRDVTSSQFLAIALQCYIASINIAQDVKGGLLKNLHLEDLRIVSLPLPPLTEQMRIVGEVERRFSVVDELEAIVDTNLQRRIRLRQSILQEAFLGTS
jgi:type I restriction enzyme S subunit